MKIRNWTKFQHYRNKGSMVWFKCYGREILNDPDWHALNAEEKATLFELWCLASEKGTGELPDIRKICFRLRKEPEYIKSMLTRLKSWIDEELHESLDSLYTDSNAEESRSEENRKDNIRKEERKDIWSLMKF
jgi:hypothetical protein